jgi:hypothetical protein
MRLPHVRFTVRRMMVAVAITGALMYAFIQFANWICYIYAIRQYASGLERYDQGRVLLPDCVAYSRRLMDAQLALCWTQTGRTAAITSHLRRAARLIDQERSFPLQLHDDRELDIAETEASLADCKELQRRLTQKP